MDAIEMKAAKLYTEIGISAVRDFAQRMGIKEVGVCVGCQCETPIYKEACLVCGTTVRK